MTLISDKTMLPLGGNSRTPCSDATGYLNSYSGSAQPVLGILYYPFFGEHLPNNFQYKYQKKFQIISKKWEAKHTKII